MCSHARFARDHGNCKRRDPLAPACHSETFCGCRFDTNLGELNFQIGRDILSHLVDIGRKPRLFRNHGGVNIRNKPAASDNDLANLLKEFTAGPSPAAQGPSQGNAPQYLLTRRRRGARRR